MSLIAELKRRKVFQVGAAYLVVAWLLVQVVATLAPQLQLPEWAPRLVTLLLMVGFPIALLIAWVFEVTPEGVRVDTAKTGSRRMFAIAAVLAVLAIGWYVRDEKRETVSESPSGRAAPGSPGKAAPESDSDTVSLQEAPPSTKSIAVLAFTDLSPGKDQEYFSDGIAEEILNALVKVKDLKVAGRTSSFYYKGRNEDLRTIGETLGVAHILEGSVRKQGERVRITAQLVKASDGYHLWSETYDGDLADVFELQERIARKITQQLEIVLSGGQQQRLVPVATENAEAYALFLQANAIFNRRDKDRMPNAISMLEDAIELDPTFARAHARLGAFHVLAPEYNAADLDASMRDALEHSRLAIELLPTLAEPHAVIAYARGMQGGRVESLAAYDRAIELEPDDVLSNFWFGLSLVGAGYRREGVERLDRVLEIDPLLPNGLVWRGWVHQFDGKLAEARRMLERALDLGIGNAHIALGVVARDEGKTDEARRELERGLTQFGAGMPPDFPGICTQGLLGDEADRVRAVEHIERVLAGRPETVPGLATWALIMLREPARALDVIQSNRTSSTIWHLALWSPDGREARRLPQFGEFARRIGYAALWDQRGAPDTCRKADNGDWTCE